ncbi:MAG TPA: nucleotide exchange factor GrpE [Holophagaceae bacterium]|jgi:molecular chaperone GrpE|nr:nucleotide exchange factor GrpE [Holophagaceae bacterium]
MNPETPLPAGPPPEEPPLPGEALPSDSVEAIDGDELPDMDTMDLQALADAAAAVEEARTKAAKAAQSTVQASAEAQKQVDDLVKRDAELNDQLRRLAADFNNFRNRAQRDIQMAVDQAEKRIYNELMPALDNFERSLEASYTDLDAFRSGVELIRKQFMDALRRLGVEPIALSVGDPFDALHAEALTTMENPALPDGAVAAVYEKGFNLRGQLLRPARVVVNRRVLLPTDPHQTQELPAAPDGDGTGGDPVN